MKTNTAHINNWIEAHGPNGHVKLSARSGVSYRTIADLRSGTLDFPKRYMTRKKLCDGLGIAHAELFPGVDDPSESVAS